LELAEERDYLKEKEKQWLDTLTRFYEISKESNFPKEFKTRIEQASSFTDSVTHSPERESFEEDHLQ
jgi:hypothetical protein